jgi:hypothetical protein
MTEKDPAGARRVLFGVSERLAKNLASLYGYFSNHDDRRRFLRVR